MNHEEKFDKYENYLYSSNPPEFRRDAWYGSIFRWYGVDRNGCIAIFETGELPIPKDVFSNEDNYRELDLFFRQLPQITTAQITEKVKILRKVNGDCIDYTDCLNESSRGLFFIEEKDTFIYQKKSFGFIEREDWYGYYLITIPEVKLTIQDLSERIRNLLEPYQFPIDFSEIEKIDITKYLICE